MAGYYSRAAQRRLAPPSGSGADGEPAPKPRGGKGKGATEPVAAPAPPAVPTGGSDRILRFPLKFGKRAEGGGEPKVPSFPLSLSEAGELRQPLIDALRTLCELADSVITHTNRAHARAFIWSALEDRELATVADLMLGQAKRDKQMAGIVRGLVQQHSRLKLMMITGGKFLETAQFYAEHGGFYLGFILPGPAATGGQTVDSGH